MFTALMAFVLVWVGTVGGGLSSPPNLSEGLQLSAPCDTAGRALLDSLPLAKTECPLGEAFAEESVDESDSTDAAFVAPPVESFAPDGISLELVGSATTRSRRVVECVGARGPPVA
jgi:hypothetical protein